jgi:signal transduction histidine kinase
MLAQQEQRAFDQSVRHARELADRSGDIITLATALAIALGLGLAYLSIRKLNARYAGEQHATEVARLATARREEILAIVSHDLRNPLTTVTMGAALLSEIAEDPRVRKHTAKIGGAAKHMRHLIDQLLDLAQLERGTLALQPERMEATSVLDAVLALFDARALESHIELAIAPPPTLAVFADRERIVQVLSNLVGNALKFTPAGGRIAVSARREGRFVRFEVSDTGAGIPADDQPKLFERYWQGRAGARGSLGLGLYISQQLVTAQGGAIGVSSQVGSGSTFWFTCPAA